MIQLTDAQARAVRDVYTWARTNTYSTLYTTLPAVQDDMAAVLEKTPVMTWQQLQESGELAHYPNNEVRYLTATFDPEALDQMFLVPQHVQSPWPQLTYALTQQTPTVALLSVPLVWQIAPYMYAACREAKVPMSVVSYRNLPLARQIMQETQAELVVSTPSIAGDIYALLKEVGLHDQIRTWVLITPFGAAPVVPALSGMVIVEQHLFPGVPVGYDVRTQHTASETIRSFTCADDWLLERSENTTLITSCARHALPLIRFDTRAQVQLDNQTYAYDE